MSSAKESNCMTSSVVKKIEELFKNPDQFSPENFEGVVQEMVQFFSDLTTKLGSSDPKEREEAQKQTDELKSKLEEQVLKLCQTIGMDPQSIAEYVNTPAHFSQEEWTAMEKAKSNLENVKKSLMKDADLDVPKKNVIKKHKNEWIVS